MDCRSKCERQKIKFMKPPLSQVQSGWIQISLFKTTGGDYFDALCDNRRNAGFEVLDTALC